MTSLKIAVADDELDMRDFYKRMLTVLGHQVIAVQDGQELVACCRIDRPDLVITDIMMPEMDGIEAVIEICRDDPLPIIVASSRSESDMVRRLESGHVMAYLEKPISRRDLEPAIALTLQRFDQFRKLRNEAVDLKQAWAARKIVEQAKRLLSKEATVSEVDAFNRIQSIASERNCKLVDAGRVILGFDDASSS